LLNLIRKIKYLTDQFQLCFCFCIGNTTGILTDNMPVATYAFVVSLPFGI